MTYCTREDIELTFGAENTKKWADMDNTNDDAFIEMRIDRAIESAEAQINTLLGSKGYVVPVVDDIPIILRDITAKLAGIILYEARGISAWDEVTGRARDALAFHRKQVNDWIRGFRSGLIVFSTLDRTTTSAPGVVKEILETSLNPWFSV